MLLTLKKNDQNIVKTKKINMKKKGLVIYA